MAEIVNVNKRDFYRINNAYRSMLFLLKFDSVKYYNNLDSVYILYDELGNRYFLFCGDGAYYIVDTSFEFADKITFFRVNENNNIVSLVPYNSSLILSDNMVSRYDNNFNKVEDVTLVLNDDNNKAALAYVQFDNLRGIRLVEFNYHDAKFDGTDKLNESDFYYPFCISFDNHIGSLDENSDYLGMYYLSQWDPSVPLYNIAYLKKFGLKKYLKRNNESFSLYHNKPIICENGVSLKRFLKYKGYTFEELLNLFKDSKFNKEVPLDMIRMFNGEDEYHKLCNDVISLMDHVKKEKNLQKILKR